MMGLSLEGAGAVDLCSLLREPLARAWGFRLRARLSGKAEASIHLAISSMGEGAQHLCTQWRGPERVLVLPLAPGTGQRVE